MPRDGRRMRKRKKERKNGHASEGASEKRDEAGGRRWEGGREKIEK